MGLPPFGDAAGQGWDQLAELGLALVLPRRSGLFDVLGT